MLGAVSPPEYTRDKYTKGEALVFAIVEMTSTIDAFFTRRGYYDEHSLKRIEKMLSRFERQITEGLRDPNTGLTPGLSAFGISPELQQSVRQVFELTKDNAWLEDRFAHNREYKVGYLRPWG